MLEKHTLDGGDTMKQSDIDSMSVNEKLHAIEALWDALGDDDLESPQWHHEILEERARALDSGNSEFISLDELKKWL